MITLNRKNTKIIPMKELQYGEIGEIAEGNYKGKIVVPFCDLEIGKKFRDISSTSPGAQWDGCCTIEVRVSCVNDELKIEEDKIDDDEIDDEVNDGNIIHY